MTQVKSLQTGIKFKDTPIGKIPVDWEVTKLQRTGLLKGGNGFPEKFQGHKDKQHFFLKVSDMNLPGNEIYINSSSNTIDKEIQAAIGCNLFPKNTIIFAKVGAALLLNRRRILTKDSCIDNNMMGLVVNKNENYKFYYYIMQTIDFAKFVSSGALPSINQSVLGGIDVISPPLPEQNKIADILTVVDDAIEQTNRIIEKTKELKKGLMQRLLTRGIGHKKFKKTGIGEMPEEWNAEPLLSFAQKSKNSFVNGPFGSDLLSKEFTTEGVPVIYVRDIKPNRYDRISTVYVSPEKAYAIGFCNVSCGDVIISKVGDPPCDAAPYFINGRAIVTQDVIRISPAEDVDTFFLCSLINSHWGRSAVKDIIIEGTRRRVSLTEFKQIILPKPPLKEQREIANILLEVDEEIRHEESHKGMIEKLKKSLMQVLLTGGIRVKLH